MRTAVILVAVTCAMRAGFAADEIVGKQLFEMRVKTGNALKSLPDYVCLQTTERLEASKAREKPKLLDKVELDVAHVGNKEMYSWPGRSMFADSELQKELSAGLVATGAYTSQLIDVLFGPATQFRWIGEETTAGRVTLRWDFTVPQASSGWTVGDGKRSAQVGATGSVWADAGTLALVRLEAHAAEFPARFPLQAVTRTIEYTTTRIGERDILLPSAVEDVVQTARGAKLINRSRFGHCREYTASSSLTFDAPVPQPAAEQPKASFAALPPGLRIPLALDGHLRSTSAVIGSAVSAHVASDVRQGANVILPKGTPVRGVIRQFAKNNDGFTFTFTLTIAFIDLALPEGAVPFRAQLKSIDSPSKGMWWLVPGQGGLMRPVHSAAIGLVDDEMPASMLKLEPQPGVAVFIFRRQESFDLIPGTRMIWITTDDALKR